MKKQALIALASLLALASARADAVLGPWLPLFRGVDHAVGTNFPSTTFTNLGVVYVNTRLQVAHCVRVDLSDPDVKLFASPPAPNPVAESRETLSLSIASFIRNNGLQAAINANFYRASSGGSEPSSEGIPCEVYGLEMCTGAVVSATEWSSRYASLLFRTNNEAVVAFNNQPPGLNTAGFYTAVTGFYPILSNGVNIAANSITAYPDSYIHQAHPRSTIGISQDRRYLLMMTIDGRQSGYSDGALDIETGYWMARFGGWDAISMDGGNSTAMYVQGPTGSPLAINHSSHISRGYERYIGSHLGVYAARLSPFITNLVAVSGTLGATITWTTFSNATTQVEYGLTTNYGAFSTLDPTPATNHSVALTNLVAGSNYFFRAISAFGTNQYKMAGQFRTKDLISGVSAVAGVVSATVTWATAAEATSQVEYGRTPSYGTLSAADLTPTTNHSVVLADLTPGSTYYLRVISMVGTNYYRATGQFKTKGLMNDLLATPGVVDATITWTTLAEATSQVEYGLTTNYGTISPLDSSLSTNHSVVLAGLSPATTYYFRAISKLASGESSLASTFQTKPLPVGTVFDMTNVWKYSTANLDGVGWTAPGYDDSIWPSGPGFLWADSRGPNTAIPMEVTQMPTNPVSGWPFPTYYLRTHFSFTNSPAGATLTFSNYLDDGAVFYLNGVEIYRAFMAAAPAVISNMSLAVSYNCSGGNATCPLVFSIAGDLITNLVAGDNVLAVEMHNYSATSPDITFGAALSYAALPLPMPRIAQQPLSRTNLVGTDARLQIEVVSSGPTDIQWLKGGSPLPGETNLVLTIANVQLPQAGNYWAVAANSAGSVTSQVAVLTVNQPPTALDRGFVTTRDQPIMIARSRLLAGAIDPDGDLLTLEVSPQSLNGALVTLASDDVIYQPASQFVGTDRFGYTVADGRGGTGSAEVEVRVVAGAIPAANHLALVPTDGDLSLRFVGEPGRRYEVQRSEDLDNWITVETVSMPIYGLIEYREGKSALSAAFYRIVQAAPGP